MTARVALIEDDDPTRAAFREAVSRDDFLVLAGEAADHDGALPLIVAGGYDVLLVDINLGDRKSFDLIELSRSNHAAKIIVISILGDEDSVITAIEAGADGYILKDGAFAKLGEPIAQVLAGEAPISPGVARHLLRRFQPTTMAGGLPLRGGPPDLLARRFLDRQTSGAAPKVGRAMSGGARLLPLTASSPKVKQLSGCCRFNLTQLPQIEDLLVCARALLSKCGDQARSAKLCCTCSESAGRACLTMGP